MRYYYMSNKTPGSPAPCPANPRKERREEAPGKVPIKR